MVVGGGWGGSWDGDIFMEERLVQVVGCKSQSVPVQKFRCLLWEADEVVQVLDLGGWGFYWIIYQYIISSSPKINVSAGICFST